MDSRVGFIGLGDIGMPMARRVIDGGFEVISSAHRRREAIDALKASGLVETDNPYEVARQSDVLITMVVDEAQTDAVLRGPQCALAGLHRIAGLLPVPGGRGGRDGHRRPGLSRGRWPPAC